MCRSAARDDNYEEVGHYENLTDFQPGQVVIKDTEDSEEEDKERRPRGRTVEAVIETVDGARAQRPKADPKRRTSVVTEDQGWSRKGKVILFKKPPNLT